MTDLGELLNTVDKPIDPCPKCGRKEPMRVYKNGVRWQCGHTRSLPPIAPTGRQSRRQTRNAS